MTPTKSTHRDLHSEQGALPGEHLGRSRNPVIKIADIAWVEFEKPNLTRAEAFARAFGFRAGTARSGRGSAARHPRGRTVCDRASWAADAIHRRSVSGLRRGRCAAAGRQIRRRCAAAAGDHRRPVGRPHRSQRHAGARRRRHARTAGATGPAAPRFQLRTRRAAHQHRPAPAARACTGAAPGPPGGAVDQVHADVELVSGQPGDDRQRLPVLPGPARTRADHELHPLRPRTDTGRSSHTGACAGSGQPLPPLGLSGQRPRRPGRRRRIPAGTAATSGPGESAGTSRAARSSTTGAIPMASWSSTSPTATCSTTPSNPAGRP